MTIIEVLVAVGLIAIVAAGVTTLAVNVYKSQNQANLLHTLTTLKISMTNLISDGASWSNTVNSPENAALACLRDVTGTCTADSRPFVDVNNPNPATYLVFTNLRDGSDVTDASGAKGAVVYSNPNGTSTFGFTADGRQCNTFDPIAGNDACPIRYRLTVRYDCIGTSPCSRPMVTVFATLTYSPSPTNPMRSVVNPNKYNVMVRRGTGLYTRNEVVYLRQLGIGAAGGGVCSQNPASPSYRIFNAKDDPAGNVLSPLPTSTVTLQAGSYNCTAGAKGFSVKGFQIGIEINNTPQPELWRSGYAAQKPGAQDEAIISQFQIIRSTNFSIRLAQICSAGPLTNYPYSESADFGLGIPTPMGSGGYASGTVYAFISCTRQF